MPFVGRSLIRGVIPPAKVYLHSNGMDLFDNSIDFGREHVNELIERNPGVFSPADYVIAALWGENGKRVSECFGYGDMGEWPGNPTVYSWVFENGVYKPEQRQISCGETLVVLGREETFRRTTRDLCDYFDESKQPDDLLRRL